MSGQKRLWQLHQLVRNRELSMYRRAILRTNISWERDFGYAGCACSANASQLRHYQALYGEITVTPDHDRLHAAIRRNIAEVNNAILKRRALSALHAVDAAHGLDFFRISAHALYNDLLSHTLKVLDHNSQSATFWYVARAEEARVKAIAKREGISMEEIERLSAPFKDIRDKTHFHIDRDAVMDPAKVWAQAGLTDDELGYVLESVWKLLSGVAREVLGANYEVPEYDGTDVSKIIHAYKAVHPDAPIAI